MKQKPFISLIFLFIASFSNVVSKPLLTDSTIVVTGNVRDETGNSLKGVVIKLYPTEKDKKNIDLKISESKKVFDGYTLDESNRYFIPITIADYNSNSHFKLKIYHNPYQEKWHYTTNEWITVKSALQKHSDKTFTMELNDFICKSSPILKSEREIEYKKREKILIEKVAGLESKLNEMSAEYKQTKSALLDSIKFFTDSLIVVNSRLQEIISVRQSKIISEEILKDLNAYFEDLKNLKQILEKGGIKDAFLFPEDMRKLGERVNEYNDSRTIIIDNKDKNLINVAHYWGIAEQKKLEKIYSLIDEEINAKILVGNYGVEAKEAPVSLNEDVITPIDNFLKQKTPRLMAQKRAVKASKIIEQFLKYKIGELEIHLDDLSDLLSEKFKKTEP